MQLAKQGDAAIGSMHFGLVLAPAADSPSSQRSRSVKMLFHPLRYTLTAVPIKESGTLTYDVCLASNV
jgi:hypothetical protein